MRLSQVGFITIPRLPSLVVGACVVGFAATTGAPAAAGSDVAIEPGSRVNGMQIVQGVAEDANATVFGTICDPVVRRPGRQTRSCGRLPRLKRIFVGYGIAAPAKEIDRAWRALSWEMWIDGRRVSLRRFGHTDRLFGTSDPAVNETLWREWSVTLIDARGGHSIRYRVRTRQGVKDTTWRFMVANR